jgi:hypothetical protein
MKPLIYCWRESEMVQLLWKISSQFLKRLNIGLPYEPVIPCLFMLNRSENIISHNNLYTKVHSSVICNSLKVEIIQISIR